MSHTQIVSLVKWVIISNVCHARCVLRRRIVVGTSRPIWQIFGAQYLQRKALLMLTDVSFVILTWNSEKCIEACLRSICLAEKMSAGICVVDNGSEDSTLEIIQKVKDAFPKIPIESVQLPENKGTTISRNIGIERVLPVSKYICILDSDTVVNEAALIDMMSVFEDNPEAGIVGPVLKGLDGSVQNSGRAIPTITLKLLKVLPVAALRQKGEQMEYISKPEGKVSPVGYLMSACWLIRRECIEDIGLLDENIFYAPEDVEYCIRAWKNGWQVLYDGRCSIVHEWQRLSRKKLISRHNWEHIKGLMYLFNKYGFYFSSERIDKYRKEL